MAKKKTDHGLLPSVVAHAQELGANVTFGHGSTWDDPYVVMVDHEEAFRGDRQGALLFVSSLVAKLRGGLHAQR